MSNLDFSGLFGGGGFSLDPSKFDFSGLTFDEPAVQPEPVKQAPKVVTRPDPIAVVSTTTDPIEEAVNSVKPDVVIPDLTSAPMGMDFGIAPIDLTATPTSNIPISSGETTNASFMDVGAGQTGLSNATNYDVGAEQTYDLLDGNLSSNSEIEDINNYLSGEQFTGYMSEYDKRLSSLGDYNRAEGATTNLLNQVGLPKALAVQGKYGGYKNYTYNGDTNQYELTIDTEKSALEAAAPDIAVAAFTAVATAGIGNALAGSSAISSVAGGNAAVSNAIGHGLASGLTTAATGGNTEDILLNTALGGLGGYTEGVSEAQELAQANVDNLSAIANSGVAGESLIAQSQLANATATLNEINATAEVVNTINNTVDLVQAVDEKDALGIVNSALALGGMNSSQTLASDKIKETFEEGSFIVDNADVIASVGVEAVATIAEGGDAKEVLQESANTLVKEVVLTDMNVKTAVQDTIGGNEFVDSNIDAITQAVKAGGIALTDGKNREETIRDAFNAYRENDGQLAPELEDSESPDFFKNIEKWYHENIEDPLEDWWQEIEPVREMFEEAGQVVVDTVDEYVVQPVTKVVESIIEGADEAVRALPTTKEDWQALEDTVKEGASDAAEVVRDTGRAIEEGYDVAEDFVKEEVAPVIRDTGRDIREAVAPVTEVVRDTGRAIEEGYGVAEDFVKEEIAPAINATGRAIREAIPDVNLDLPDVDVDLPDVDLDIPLSVSADPEITKERRSFYYDDSDLVRNPFLNNQQQRIRSLTDMIAFDKEQKERQAKILADEEKRKLRYKSVYGVNPNIKVEYTG